MKGSVKSQLNYADIHQSPVVKCFVHKILRLLSAVTNEGSHSLRGLKELETSPFLYHVSKTTQHAPEHWLSTPESSFGCTDPQDRFRERAARVQTSPDVPSPFSPLAPYKCGHNINFIPT